MLTPHFEMSEFLVTSVPIDNIPSEYAKKNIRFVANCLEHARKALDKPIYINSGFRTKEVNKAVGGSNTSLHMAGLAVDINISNIGYKDMPQFLRALLDTEPNEVYPISHTAMHISWHPDRRNIINDTFNI